MLDTGIKMLSGCRPRTDLGKKFQQKVITGLLQLSDDRYNDKLSAAATALDPHFGAKYFGEALQTGLRKKVKEI
jgi:hypothetical protein